MNVCMLWFASPTVSRFKRMKEYESNKRPCPPPSSPHINYGCASPTVSKVKRMKEYQSHHQFFSQTNTLGPNNGFTVIYPVLNGGAAVPLRSSVRPSVCLQTVLVRCLSFTDSFLSYYKLNNGKD